jgi:RNA-binding protein NOB1
MAATTPTTKPVHTVVLDTGSIIKNEPSVSTLISQAEQIVTVPAIVAEIKDSATRSRFETTLKPFITLRSPRPASVQVIIDFARKTGDLAVLSKPDIQIIALAYELECERNGGDWRLRRNPGQKGMNGPPPGRAEAAASASAASAEGVAGEDQNAQPAAAPSDSVADVSIDQDDVPQSSELSEATSEDKVVALEPDARNESQNDVPQPQSSDGGLAVASDQSENAKAADQEEAISTRLEQLDVTDSKQAEIEREPAPIDSAQQSAESQNEFDSDSGSDSDSGGWITPSNLKKKQAADASGSMKEAEAPATMQVAVITTDFAMQNVILQMNLNLLSTSMFRVKRLNTYVLRCHACFNVCRDMTKQFCPRCGQATLTRVACSTSASGEFRLHLKKNMQWNHRGDRYSIPKPVHGSSNGKLKGGGKGGWGNELMLAEDQKEYESAKRVQQRQKTRNLMDEDYLPGILTGDRGKGGGRIKVGAGRNVNSKKR